MVRKLNSKLTISFALVLLFSVAVTTHFSLNKDRIILDGYFAEAESLFYNCDTEYSSGYTHEKFSKIKKGMDQEEVVKLLGYPLEIEFFAAPDNYPITKKIIFFDYSYSPAHSYHRQRRVLFHRGKVAKTISGYFIPD